MKWKRLVYFIFAFNTVVLMFLGCDNEKVNEQKKPVEVKILSEAQKAKAKRLDTLFNGMFSRNEFIGNVLIAENGLILYKKSFGVSDECKKQLNNDSTLFQIASVSKTFTACLTLQLVDSGLIDLNADIRKYLPEFPYEGIKVKHLLCHRSGLFNYIYFIAELYPDSNRNLSNKEIYDLICQQQPKPYYKPDIQFNYCNTNFMLLTLITENATKKKFKDLIKEFIFRKCEMNRTFFADEIDADKNIAKGYTFSMKEVSGDRFDYVWGDKGIYTTSNDLFKFEEAYFNGKLISKKLMGDALKPYSSERKLGNYGYGWRMKDFDTNEKIIYHNGWWHGYRSALQRRLKDSTSIIILSNRLNRSVYETWRVFNALDGKPNPAIDKEESEE